MSIHLHIDRLVLEGLPLSPTDGPLLQAALESELTRLMGDGLSPELAEGAAVPRNRRGLHCCRTTAATPRPTTHRSGKGRLGPRPHMPAPGARPAVAWPRFAIRRAAG